MEKRYGCSDILLELEECRCRQLWIRVAKERGTETHLLVSWKNWWSDN